MPVVKKIAIEEPWKNSNRNKRLTSLLSEGRTNKKFRMDLRKLREKDLDRYEGKLMKKGIGYWELGPCSLAQH